MGEGKRLVKNTLIIAIAGVATKLAAFLLLPVYTAVLNTSEYGTYDYIATLTIFLIPIITMLLDEAMFRFLIDCKSMDEKQKVVTTAILIEMCGVGVFSVIMLVLGRIIDYPYLNWTWACVLAATTPFLINPILRGQGKYLTYAIYNGLMSILISVLSILLLFMWEKSVRSLLLASVISYLISAVAVCMYIRIWKYINIRNFSATKAAVFIKYAMPLIPNKLSWSCISIADRIILFNSMGSAEAGIYAISNKFPFIMDSIYGFFSTAWQESASRVLVNENRGQFYNMAYQYMLNFVLSINGLLCAAMPFIFAIMIDDSFSEALQYIPILLLSTIFSEVSVFYGGLFYAYKDTHIIGKSTVIAAILKIILTLVLIQFIGIYGCAVSTLLSNIFLCLYRSMKVQQYVVLCANIKVIVVSGLMLGIYAASFYLFDYKLQILCCVLAAIYALLINRELIKKMLGMVRRQ